MTALRKYKGWKIKWLPVRKGEGLVEANHPEQGSLVHQDEDADEDNSPCMGLRR